MSIISTEPQARAAREWLEGCDGHVWAAAHRQTELATAYRNGSLTEEETAELEALNDLDDCINLHTENTLAALVGEGTDFVTPEHSWVERCREIAEERGLLDDVADRNPLFRHVDWYSWADYLRTDYAEFEVGGMTFIVG